MISLDQHAFIVTRSGIRFDMLSPRAEDVRIDDIAHALSNLCRFTGHTYVFYSVAEHSWLVSCHCNPAHALEGLLHDAAEAYINDLSRPLKHHPQMSVYRDIEARIQGAIRQRFGLPSTPTKHIKDIDNMIVCDEGIVLMAESGWTKGHARLGIDEFGMSPAQAETAFMMRYQELADNVAAA